MLSDPIDLPTQCARAAVHLHLSARVGTRRARRATLFQYVAGKPGDFTAAATLPDVRLMRIPPYVTLVEVQADERPPAWS